MKTQKHARFHVKFPRSAPLHHNGKGSINWGLGGGGGGGAYLKKGTMHTHQVGWLFWQISKKGPKTRGFFLQARV